jgi:hypothetical protein
MSMLDRYRKPGGFFQLVSLVETCGPAKQEKFLEIIRAESPSWAEAIKTKMIDINRIYTWSDETLREIMGTLQDLTIAITLHASSDPIKARIYATLTQGRRRKIEDLYGSNNPSVGELSATHLKIIETVRKMAHDGYLRFDKIDPQLFIDDKIEENLAKIQSGAITSATTNPGGHLGQAGHSTSHSEFAIEYDASQGQGSDAASDSGGGSSGTADLLQLKKKLADLSKENAVLRHELSLARNKLDQIKKIA